MVFKQKKVFFFLNFLSLFFQIISLFNIRNWFHKKNSNSTSMGFLGPPSKPVKLPSPLIGILSEFSSSWKIPNGGSRFWLLQGHNLSTIVYYTMKSAKLYTTFNIHKCFIQCTVHLKTHIDTYSGCTLKWCMTFVPIIRTSKPFWLLQCIWHQTRVT